MEDPTNVDSHGAKMGLNTMQENLNRWNPIWEVNVYLEELSVIEAKEQELNNKK